MLKALNLAPFCSAASITSNMRGLEAAASIVFHLISGLFLGVSAGFESIFLMPAKYPYKIYRLSAVLIPSQIYISIKSLSNLK